MFSAVESFLFISSSGFSCFCHRVRSRTRKPLKVLISNFFEVLRLYLNLSTFLNIPGAQSCFFLRPNCYLDIKLVAFSQFRSNGNRQQRAVFYLESFLFISSISGFSFLTTEHIRKPGNHGNFL